ncbi:hypothetical protein GCM10011505_37750 [Tistrella bauzanensis]|uniref:SciE type virulence protein n=1 Tax=Tistrella bauzanensis TaxID=657419 RepID=A0ABQ1IVI4_9PROT|nr:type VI secretion system accessory protein TagJ [Tistrella bauzanensis]GGB53183.1 hypothetical protein GCM10011505_37750 [Tistrella bauzanensis]
MATSTHNGRPRGQRRQVDVHGAINLIEAGHLGAALSAQAHRVWSRPDDVGARLLLAELLIVDGAFGDARRHLETVLDAPGDAAAEVLAATELIRLIEAEQLRLSLATGGVRPGFLSPPPDHVEKTIEMHEALAEGATVEAATLAAEARSLRPRVAMTIDGKDVTDLRDACDLSLGVFEIMTDGGLLLWVPMEQVRCLHFRRPRRFIDAIWRPVVLEVGALPEGALFMPTIYAGTAEIDDDAAKLGRRTDWIGSGLPGRGPVVGLGQRCFLADEDLVAVSEIVEVHGPGGGGDGDGRRAVS